MVGKKGTYRPGAGGYRVHGHGGVGRKFPCQCCGSLTVTSANHDADDICPVCFWHDDPCYFEVTDEPFGPNETSLVEAQANFREFGACERRFVRHIHRPPHPKKPARTNRATSPKAIDSESSVDE